MPNEKEILLKSGKRVKIRMPPFNLEYMLQLQKSTVKKTLVNPEIMAILNVDEIQELFLKVSDINLQYWMARAQNISKHGSA